MFTNAVVNDAIEYIMKHIEENIQIEDVADYCHFSKYYFCRVFKEETGESIYSFIKKVKLEQSAFRLKVEKDKSITDIGCEYGYSSSNYSSAFKKHHDASPVEFRREIFERSMRHPFYPGTVNHIETMEECEKKVDIEEFPDRQVIFERNIGSYHNLGDEWCAFLDKYKDYMTEQTLLLERTFDDPSITENGKCLYDICISIEGECSLENVCTIEGGKFAVYHFTGQPEQIYAAYQTMFNIWIPENHLEIDRRYGFECYREINEETNEMKIDICIPVV